MKKLICLLLFAFTFGAGYSQILTKPSNPYGTISNRQSPDSAQYIPTDCGVPHDTASLYSVGFGQGQKMKKGALYYDSCGHHMYVYDPTVKDWHRVDSGSGGSGGGMDTMYRKPGKDSIYYTINGGPERRIKDSTGGGGSTPTIQDVLAAGNRITVSPQLIKGTGPTVLQLDSFTNINWRFKGFYRFQADGGQATFIMTQTAASLTAGDGFTISTPSAGFFVQPYSFFSKPVSVADTFKYTGSILKPLDTTNYKIGVFDASGNMFKMNWQVPGAGSGITSLNGLTGSTQTFATGASGSDFNISSSGTAHTFNIPDGSPTNRGLIISTDWNTFNGKQAALVSGTNIKTINGNSILGSGDLSISGGGSLSRPATDDSISNGSSTVIDKDNANNDAWHNKNYLPNFEPTLERAKRKTCYFNIGAIGDSFIDGLRFETAFKNAFGDRFPGAGPGMMSSDASNYNFGGSTDLTTAHWTKQLGNGLDLWSIKSTSISTNIDFANSGSDRGGFNGYDSIRFFYLIKTGGGTFQILLNASVLATVNTSTGTNGTLGIVALGGFVPDAANDFIIHQTTFNSVGVEILGYKAFLKGGGVLVNRIGHSGAVTADYLNADSTIQAQLLQEASNDVLYFCIGINDRRQIGGAETIAQYHANMRRFINRVKLATPKTKIVLVAQPEYDYNIWGGEANTAIEYANEIRKISITDSCGFIDIARIFGDSAQMRKDSVLEDGLHPSYASWGGPLMSNMLGMIPEFSAALSYVPQANYDFKQWTWKADYHHWQDRNGLDMMYLTSGASTGLHFTPGGDDQYKAGINVGPGYMAIGMNESNLFGVNPSWYGAAILIDARYITSSMSFYRTSATSGCSGSMGDNGFWQLGSRNQTPTTGLYLDYTNQLRVPVGTTAQRLSGGAGHTRYNTDSAGAFFGFEGYNDARGRWELFASNARLDSLALLIGGNGNPFSDASALVKNSSDATKQVTLSAASVSTATTRTWTFPDVSGTFARIDAAQTFTGIQDFISSPTMPTPSPGDNSSKGAPTAFVTAAIAALPTLASGTFTPTLSSPSNVTSTSILSASYIRVGNVVTVSIGVALTVTTASTLSQITMTLPVTTSNTTQTAVGNCGITYAAAGGNPGTIVVNSSTTANFSVYTVSNGIAILQTTFQYTL